MNLEKLTIENLSNRALSRNQAQIIADRMYGLGENDRKKVAVVLGGRKGAPGETWDDLVAERFKLYEELDQTSQLIINLILVQNPLDEVVVDFDYFITCLRNTRDALHNINTSVEA